MHARAVVAVLDGPSLDRSFAAGYASRVRIAIIVTAALAWLLASGCTFTQVGGDDSLRAMTFNLRYANPDDGPDRWELRQDLVFAFIREQEPDIVGLQEALALQMDALRAEFPSYRFLGQGRSGGRRGEFSALMIRSERFEVIEHGDFWLSPTPEQVASKGWDAALPRMCTWAVLRDRCSHRKFVVMNTHFDHRGEIARRESAEVLMAQRARFADLALILLGDLNAAEDSPPLRRLREGGMRDSYRDLHPHANQVGTFHGFRGSNEGDKIDYVLVDQGWITLSAAILRDHRGERFPSDHFAVIATLRLTR